MGGKAKRVTPEPLAVAADTAPIEFGRERCFAYAVRTVEVTTGVTSLGPPSAPACVTPVDHFAPAPPMGLNAFQGEGVIDLLWTASTAVDVAGHLLARRGRGWHTAAAYDDADRGDAVSGSVSEIRCTYSYQIVAVDGAMPPKISDPSNRFVVTARRP